jgi:hypothetical protein
MTMSTVGSRRWWQGFHAVAAYALSIIAAVAANGKLNDALANMHPSGQGWGSYATISAPSTLWAPEPATQSITGWRAWEQAEIGVAHGIRVMPVLLSSAAVDLVLLSIPIALLIRIAARVAAERYPRIGPTATGSDHEITATPSDRGGEPSSHTDLGALD